MNPRVESLRRSVKLIRLFKKEKWRKDTSYQ